jgi:predicted  nucleic acid-binding Zn-ribbon protein
MMLDSLYQVIDDLSMDELDTLSEYIEQQREQRRLAQYTTEERIQKIEAAFAELREGLTQAELDEITEAMNSEVVEPFDESEWRD